MQKSSKILQYNSYCMTKQVAFRDKTYERLRRRKRKSESFSDVVERLMEAAPEEKDPLSFARRPWKRRLSVEEHLDLVEADRDADRV